MSAKTNLTDLEKVKKLTKAYIRSFEIKPQGDLDIVNHPVAADAYIPHPKNPRYGLPKPQGVIDAWIASGSKEFLDLTDPDDLKIWYSIIDERIDAAKNLEAIYTGIIRRNWIESWLGCVKEFLSSGDQQKVKAAVEDHMKWVDEEQKRLFGNK